MAARRQRRTGPAKAALVAMLEHRLATAMGIRLTLLERLVGTGPGTLAASWLLLYGATVALVLWWSNGGRIPDDGHAKLATLLIWKTFEFAALLGITRLATERVLEIVRRDIVPFASESYAAAVGAALGRRNTFVHNQLLPYAVATAVVVASAWSLRHDLFPVWSSASGFPLDLALWTATLFYVAFLSMRVVVTTAFPWDFAAAVEQDWRAFYPLDAANSPLIQGLARLNRTILAYWAIVFSVFATVMLLVLPPAPFGLTSGSPFLFILIPVVAFLSLGMGARVYLESQFIIGTALRRFSLERAEELQREIAALLKGRDGDNKASAARIERLMGLHDRMIAGGSYGSRLETAIGVGLPFVMPAIGLIEKLFR